MTKILVVEDDEDIVEVMKIALEARGYEVSVALNGEEALDKGGKVKPDIILLDLMIPKIDGHNVNLKLKENPDTAGIPVIVITGKGNLKELLDLREGVTISGYLEKPVPIKVIVQKIEEVLVLK
jgi:CheY-like chemotaxis protein